MEMINKLSSLAVMAAWLIGMWVVAKMLIKGAGTKQIVQTFIIVGVFSVFAKNPKPFMALGDKIITTLTSIVNMFNI